MYASPFRDVFVDDSDFHLGVWRMDYLARQAAFGESDRPKRVVIGRSPRAARGQKTDVTSQGSDKKHEPERGLFHSGAEFST
ncbi:hypothetical protein D3C87_736780 [compost metagenome]